LNRWAKRQQINIIKQNMSQDEELQLFEIKSCGNCFEATSSREKSILPIDVD